MGEINEALIQINDINTTALLDTGSCVSLLSKGFYDSHLSSTEIKPLAQLLHIECADGNALPYLGYIEVELGVMDDLRQTTTMPCMFLVTPDTPYTIKTPILLGTNILQELVTECRGSQGDRFLQTMRLTSPWYFTFRAINGTRKGVKAEQGSHSSR